jgi:short-subunit dehydrogenase
VLTGAGSGIGAALARRLADRGDDLVLLVRDEHRAEQLRPLHPRAEFVLADLAEPGTLNGIARLVDGPVDSLLQVAGVVDLAPVGRLRLDDWQRQLDVNLTSPAVLTREFLPALRAARGTVVFVNSTAGLTANPTWSGYSAAKFGLRALADALRAEERAQGVAVTTVFPSRTATPMQESVHAQEGRAYDPAEWSDPDTVALTIQQVLDLPPDSSINEVTVRPR